MRPIDAVLLKEIAQGGSPALIDALAPELAQQLPAAGLDTPLRAAHFLAQIAYESDLFMRLVEDLDYSAARIAQVWPPLAPRAAELAHNPVKLANAAYGLDDGNHGEASGDGWSYHGRGLIQITGRWNYTFFGNRIGVNLEDSPDKAADPAIAARLALAFWASRDCNADADRDDTEAVTRRINPACEGLTERDRLKRRAYALLTTP